MYVSPMSQFLQLFIQAARFGDGLLAGVIGANIRRGFAVDYGKGADFGNDCSKFRLSGQIDRDDDRSGQTTGKRRSEERVEAGTASLAHNHDLGWALVNERKRAQH